MTITHDRPECNRNFEKFPRPCPAPRLTLFAEDADAKRPDAPPARANIAGYSHITVISNHRTPMIHILSGRSGNRLSIHNHKISAARPVRIFPGPVRGGPLLPAPQTFFRPFFTPRRAFLINIVSVKDQIGQISDSITLRGWYKPLRTDCLRRPRTAKRSFDVYAVTRPAACSLQRRTPAGNPAGARIGQVFIGPRCVSVYPSPLGTASSKTSEYQHS